MSSTSRGRCFQRRLRAQTIVGVIAALATLSTERFGLLRCFAPGAPRRGTGRSAGSASSAQDKLGRVARQEALDFKSVQVLAPNSRAHPRMRLMQALHDGGVAAEDLDVLFLELLANTRSKAGARDVSSAFDGTTWRLLGAGRPGSSGAAAPRLALYSGGQFLHEGSIHNGGLFKAVLETQAADVKLGVPEVRMAEGRILVSVDVAAAPGREKTLAYTTEFTPMSPTSFRRSLVSLELPEPVGSLTPLVESNDMISVAYWDDDLLVLQDENGLFEFLVHESVRVASISDTLAVHGEVFLKSAIGA